MNNKTFFITLGLVLALVAVAQISARPQMAATSTPPSSLSLLGSRENAINASTPKVVETDGGEAMYWSDFSDDRNLVGASQYIFIGKVLGEVKSEGWYTTFSVQVIDNVKGNLSGTVNVGVTGGYHDGVFYVAKGNTWLAPGSTYLLATRYRSIDDSYRLIRFDTPVSWKLLSGDSASTDAQLQAIAQNDPRVQQLTAAYPNEVLDQADIYNHTAFNSYASLHPVLPPPPAPPSAPSSTEEINPPIISNLTSVVASTSITISWTTNKPATSELLFGSSTAMVANVPPDTALVTIHSRLVFGLVPGTTYYYEAQSTDSSGQTTNSSQQTFTTLGQSDSTQSL
jgi:hypothetical protein